MSGIAGWIAAPRRAPDAQAAGPMLAALAHRGAPGASPCEFVSSAGGHTVLIAACGAAPARDRAAGLALAFDGAIDNRAQLRAQLELRGYRFEQGGDAELALRAYQHWDKEVARHLRGQFAFVAWDARKERLLVARDRFGEKPMYLLERGGRLYFASEIKALLKAPGEQFAVDGEAVNDCIAHRYVAGPRTLFAGVRKLAPASFALWQFGKLREFRYWSPPDQAPRAVRASGADPAAEFSARLDDVVRQQTAAGGCGVLLSGGLDSAVLTALMIRHQPQLASFSLGIADDAGSELPQAAQVAKHFGTDHHEVVASRQELAASLPRVIALRDAPLALPSDLALHALARAAAARGLGALLSGEGCDEILGGYRRHAVALMLPGARSLRETLSGEQGGWLADNRLARGERLAAAASLQARAPFVDHCLAEFVSALPDAQRVRGLSTKRILHGAARGLLPDRLPKRRKLGFRVPLEGLLRGELRESLAEHLGDRRSLAREFCEPKALERVMAGHLKGNKKHDNLLWTLLNLEIWRRTYAPA
jgi:asparagine synthase (glutamine-hydrolysing)